MNNSDIRSAEKWITHLGLQKHPEGGWFRETYRSIEKVNRKHLPERFSGDRSFSTAIYFLLKSGEFSAFHRIKQDEIWHFHDGSPLVISVIDNEGQFRKLRLGITEGGQPQHLIEAGCLFAAAVDHPGSYTLVSCTVAPGFDFDDFEMPSREYLLKLFPQYKSEIEKFTRG